MYFQRNICKFHRLPASLCPVMAELSEIGKETAGEIPVRDITKAERHRLAELIKAFPLTITGTGRWEEAVITQGGISVKEIDPATMQSRLCPGLYAAGEVLDLDALTGGFNLQIAWTTGYAAGKAAGKR
ncbi:MAG: NAD(P)/FAD-dependent oxidoreductase [Erysipelotrichaceae bacterium]|nr:NAD(P)/FAD-dependent oxidoreductase [Erysipelotrichaceae bacterium]